MSPSPIFTVAFLTRSVVYKPFYMFHCRGIFNSDKKSDEDYTIQNTDLKVHMSSNTGLLHVSISFHNFIVSHGLEGSMICIFTLRILDLEFNHAITK